MQCSTILEKYLKKGNLSESLFMKVRNKKLVADLQRVLFELGFKKKLKWDKYQADGKYGKATQASLIAFAKKNDLETDGRSVSDELAKVLLERHDFLPGMYILWAISKSDLRKRKYISKGTRMSIVSIQLLLNDLGYGKHMKFDRYGADGLYGKFTRKAMIAFAKDNDCECDGDHLTRPVVDLLLEKIDVYYGPSWKDLANNSLPSKDSPLVFFQGSRFIGKPCRADKRFVPLLKRINKYAEEADVDIVVTSSFRTTTNVAGAIVRPARYSNHLIGHGIDMNLAYGNGKHANSKELTKYPNVAKPVAKFLKSIIDDEDLRWGGTFRNKDSVHIDDHYNKDKKKWKKRYKLMQEAAQLGAG